MADTLVFLPVTIVIFGLIWVFVTTFAFAPILLYVIAAFAVPPSAFAQPTLLCESPSNIPIKVVIWFVFPLLQKIDVTQSGVLMILRVFLLWQQLSLFFGWDCLFLLHNPKVGCFLYFYHHWHILNEPIILFLDIG